MTEADNLTGPTTKDNNTLARVFNAFIIIGGSYCAVFGVFFFSSGNKFLAAVHAFGFIVIAANYVIITLKKSFETGINIVLGVGNVVVVSLFATGGLDGTGFLWPLVYLPFSAFITNRRYTGFWVAALMGSCLIVLGLHLAGIITIPYSNLALFSYFAGLVIQIVCIFLFQRTTVDYEEYIRSRDKADATIRRQAALMQMLPDAIIYGDMENQIVSLNAGAEKMLAVNMQEAAGKRIDEILSIEYIRSIIGKNTEPVDDTGSERNEALVTNLRGEKFTVLVNVKNLERLPGNESGWVTIYTDISLLKLNEELKLALEKLEKNNEYLEQLAYISAHDIKSPIITVEGLVGRLTKNEAVKNENGQVLRLLTSTISQMKNTNIALNNVLKARKNLVRTGERHDRFLPLQQILDDVAATIQPNLAENNATLEINADGIENSLFPEVQFKSIFLNLLGNAIKFRDPDRQLKVSVTAGRTPKGLFIFKIQDNGLGMDMEANKDKLFGMFKRFHPHIEGSGIGLHIVKSIIDAYDGTVEVESTEGLGTVFKIYFNPIAFTLQKL